MTTLIPTFYARKLPGNTAPLCEFVHPEDQKIVSDSPALPALTLYECYTQDEVYTLVRRTSQETPFRIRTDCLLPLAKPAFSLGEWVAPVGEDPAHAATVYRIEWHALRGHEVYYVQRGVKLSSRRFLPTELMPCRPAG